VFFGISPGLFMRVLYAAAVLCLLACGTVSATSAVPPVTLEWEDLSCEIEIKGKAAKRILKQVRRTLAQARLSGDVT
jgi:hypothetical protein